MIEKNKEILMVIAVIMLVMLAGLWITNHNQNKALNELKVELNSAKQPSEIEKIKLNFDKNKKEVNEYKIKLENTKKDYEVSVWKDRCLEKKLINTKENCEENLERFAVWEQGL